MNDDFRGEWYNAVRHEGGHYIVTCGLNYVFDLALNFKFNVNFNVAFKLIPALQIIPDIVNDFLADIVNLALDRSYIEYVKFDVEREIEALRRVGGLASRIANVKVKVYSELDKVRVQSLGELNFKTLSGIGRLVFEKHCLKCFENNYFRVENVRYKVDRDVRGFRVHLAILDLGEREGEEG